VDAYRSGGDAHVRLTVIGRPERLPPEVGEALYRVCVEGLTNVRRHASSATDVDVALEVAAREVTLVVTNTGGQARGGRRARTRAGTGLLSSHARVEALGGHFQAGPERDGWSVRARLPVRDESGV
jgi:signal transduction histidine kinase